MIEPYEDLEWLETKMDRGTITLEEHEEMENLRALWYQEKSKMKTKDLITTYTIRSTNLLNRVLWKLGAERRKRVLKFFGKWTMEDELFEILSDEIRKEIDMEILSKVKVNYDEN